MVASRAPGSGTPIFPAYTPQILRSRDVSGIHNPINSKGLRQWVSVRKTNPNNIPEKSWDWPLIGFPFSIIFDRTRERTRADRKTILKKGIVMVKVVSTSFVPREEMEMNRDVFAWNEHNNPDGVVHSDEPAADEPADESDRKGVRLW